MCGSTLGKITDAGLFGAAKPFVDSRKKRKAVRQQEAAAKNVRLKKEAKSKKQASTREKQITRFSANVASGGAKRAANV